MWDLSAGPGRLSVLELSGDRAQRSVSFWMRFGPTARQTFAARDDAGTRPRACRSLLFPRSMRRLGGARGAARSFCSEPATNR
jgi:hypothetical protein